MNQNRISTLDSKNCGLNIEKFVVRSIYIQYIHYTVLTISNWEKTKAKSSNFIKLLVFKYFLINSKLVGLFFSSVTSGNKI